MTKGFRLFVVLVFHLSLNAANALQGDDFFSDSGWDGMIPTVTVQGATSNDTIFLAQGNAYTFAIEASDSDGDLGGSEWYLDNSLIDGHVMSGSLDSNSCTHIFNSPGLYTVSASIYDEQNQYSQPVEWVVQVDRNEAPKVSRNFPDINIDLKIGESYDFVVKGTDTDGNLEGCEWYIGGNFMHKNDMAGELDRGNWSFKFDSLGTHVVKAIVYDAEGRFSSSLAWIVKVDEEGASEDTDPFSVGQNGW